MRIIESMGALWANHGSGLARGVEMVALCDLVGLAFGGASLGAGLRVGFQEDADFGVWQDHGTDVAAFHNHAGEALITGELHLRALVFQEEGTDGREGGDFRDGSVDLRRT